MFHLCSFVFTCVPLVWCFRSDPKEVCLVISSAYECISFHLPGSANKKTRLDLEMPDDLRCNQGKDGIILQKS